MRINLRDNTHIEGADLLGFVGVFIVVQSEDEEHQLAVHRDCVEAVAFEQPWEVKDFREAQVKGWVSADA